LRVLFEECPLCASENFTFLREYPLHGIIDYPDCVPKVMRWMRCVDCYHVFTDGILTPEAFAAVIGASPPHQNLSVSEFAFLKYLCNKIVRRASRLAPKGKWLDIGFGNATLLCAAKDHGYAPFGIDLRQDNIDKARKLGISASLADVTSLETEDSYDVVSMADVLEHVPYPRDAIKAAIRALKPTGALFISCPDYDCLDWSEADKEESNPYWGEVEHYHNFSAARLCTILKEFGYKMVDRAKSERFIIGMELIFVKGE
jgi:SAM-dependent methyltransferase